MKPIYSKDLIKILSESGMNGKSVSFHLNNKRTDPKGCSGFIVHNGSGKTVYVDTSTLNMNLRCLGCILIREATDIQDFQGKKKLFRRKK